ncbi:MAG TPA: IS66 family transposase [Bryobacteraceae bacterium]|nr:IS66 family transposase [Bryobacteraceae bacterium]
MKLPPLEPLDVTREDLAALLERARQGPLNEADFCKLKALVDTLGYLTELVADKETTIRHLRQLLLPQFSTEKTRIVLGTNGSGAESVTAPPAASGPVEQREGEASAAVGRPGHGRNPASAYAGARKVRIQHPQLKHGDVCPECGRGKVYEQKDPVRLVRVVGQAPLQATVYELDHLRCGLCGQVFMAPEPDGVGTEKYDESAGAMIAQLKYGSGMPFNRLRDLEQRLGIPLPAATQWEIVEGVAMLIQPAVHELIRQAAQGSLFHNDDTSMRILKLKRPAGDERTGIFTSGIVSVIRLEGGWERHVALFFSGAKHAGENLALVLEQREREMGAAIQMSDALSRNVPELGPGVELLIANCLAHGRRQFIEIAGNFPEQCRYVLETLGKVYALDALVRERKLSPAERLSFHQKNSKPLMDGLVTWFRAQLDERKVEPNSSLGKAINYMLRHWPALTLFLEKEGAPLDNNIAERALKRAVLHRKNALFYRTLNGAEVGDLFMSLIHTCQLNGVNSFDYLVELQLHADQLTQNPADWMPWSYRDTLVRMQQT